MKKNRMAKKNRKFIKGSAAYYKRKFTQYYQKEARKNGTTYSPRGLARCVGIFVGMVTDDIDRKHAVFNWKAYMEAVVNHPREFHQMMNPVKNSRDSSGKVNRVIRKVEA